MLQTIVIGIGALIGLYLGGLCVLGVYHFVNAYVRVRRP